MISGHAPQQQPNGTRAKAAQVGRNPTFEHLGKTRNILRRVPGAKELIGQVIQLPDGRAIRVMGLDILVSANEHTYAGAVSYGCAADATFVNRRLKPVGKLSRVPSLAERLSRPTHAPTAIPADATAVARPYDLRDIRPQPPAPVLTRQQQAAQRVGAIEKNWNGVGSMLEGYGLVNKSITPVNNSAFRTAQRINRLVGKKVIVPSHLASRAAATVRAVAPARAASFVGKIGKVAGPVGLFLTAANIAVEINSLEKGQSLKAHTYVNGAMLLVSGAGLLLAGTAAAPVFVVAGAVIAVYGILDFTFDIGEKVIDPAFSN